MRVIESLCLGKHSEQKLCEDSIVVSDRFIAVIDGSTDKTGWSYDGIAGGRLASTTLADLVPTIPEGAGAIAAINHLSRGLLERMGGEGPADSPSAAIGIYSQRHRQVWRVGDVSFAELGRGITTLRTANRKKLDISAGQVRAALTYALMREGLSEQELLDQDPGRRCIMPLLQEQFRLRNVTGAWTYGAIDGRPVPKEHISVTDIDPMADELVLYSDGYPKAYPSLEAAERDLAKLIQTDPLCIGPLIGTKGVQGGDLSFDDRSYIRFQLNEGWLEP